MKAVGVEIQTLILENKALLSVEDGNERPEWSNYELYIDDIIHTSLVTIIGCR